MRMQIAVIDFNSELDGKCVTSAPMAPLLWPQIFSQLSSKMPKNKIYLKYSFISMVIYVLINIKALERVERLCVV